MTAIESGIQELLLDEFEREARTTRRLLERLSDANLGWQPHEKSFTAGELASHIVECIRWTETIFGGDELDMDPFAYQPYHATSVADLLETFDRDVAAGRKMLAGVSSAALMHPWRLKLKGTQKLERPKAAAFRDFTLSHIIHHRGQLSVRRGA